MLLNKHEFCMAISAVPRECTLGSRWNSRKYMTSPRREMRPDSPALPAEQFHVRNETCKEP